MSIVYRDGDDTAYVFGDVNAKNEYGAYTGFESFMGKVYINNGKFVPLVRIKKTDIIRRTKDLELIEANSKKWKQEFLKKN
ncbi:MAG: hypothetical protein ACRCZ3_01630 [Providencia rustigianii]|uniref:hypothetical protein n=1 Tax=Providencia rustigianii TaxID=158850 RepID=UPI003F410D31